MPSREEWQAYSSDRQKILQQDPALAAEYKELIAEIQAEREKLNAAMIQADPKAAPIIAKLDAMQNRSEPPRSPVPPPPRSSK